MSFQSEATTLWMQTFGFTPPASRQQQSFPPYKLLLPIRADEQTALTLNNWGNMLWEYSMLAALEHGTLRPKPFTYCILSLASQASSILCTKQHFWNNWRKKKKDRSSEVCHRKTECLQKSVLNCSDFCPLLHCDTARAESSTLIFLKSSSFFFLPVSYAEEPKKTAKPTNSFSLFWASQQQQWRTLLSFHTYNKKFSSLGPHERSWNVVS